MIENMYNFDQRENSFVMNAPDELASRFEAAGLTGEARAAMKRNDLKVMGSVPSQDPSNDVVTRLSEIKKAHDDKNPVK